jgi:preprotein translocase subunit SecB
MSAEDNNINQENDQKPHVSVNAQYIKDLSFESPNAPTSLGKSDISPSVSFALDIDIKRVGESETFKVALNITSTASRNSEVAFIIELVYEGIFTLTNINEDNYHFILGVHCPGILFPFARRIIADVTQSGGFQPLMIDPIDFAALYHKRLLEQNAANGSEASNNGEKIH